MLKQITVLSASLVLFALGIYYLYKGKFGHAIMCASINMVISDKFTSNQ